VLVLQALFQQDLVLHYVMSNKLQEAFDNAKSMLQEVRCGGIRVRGGVGRHDCDNARVCLSEPQQEERISAWADGAACVSPMVTATICRRYLDTGLPAFICVRLS